MINIFLNQHQPLGAYLPGTWLILENSSPEIFSVLGSKQCPSPEWARGLQLPDKCQGLRCCVWKDTPLSLQVAEVLTSGRRPVCVCLRERSRPWGNGQGHQILQGFCGLGFFVVVKSTQCELYY